MKGVRRYSTGSTDAGGQDKVRRAAVMRVLAEAHHDDLSAAWEAWSDQPRIEDVRRPEVGLVMVHGRIGGDGQPFNLGEATVTRAAVRIGGALGHGYVLGRAPEKARLAAIFDALWQSAERGLVESRVIEPLRAKAAAADARQAAETAATKVDFFTLVRGED